MPCRGCADRTSTGCLCSTAASDCFSVAGAGSGASPFTISPDLDVDADNLFTCGASGLLASLPARFTNPPFASVRRASNQSIANNTMTAMAWTIETYDTDTMFASGSNTRITFTTAGIYIVTFYGLWFKNATGDRVAQIRKNGTDVLQFDSKPASGADLFVGHSLTIQEEFAATDYVEAMVQQVSGGSLSIVAEHGSPLFVAEKMDDA